MPTIIRKGQLLEVVFKCGKCQIEFVCDTSECFIEKNEKSPNKPFYCYECPNCKEKCSSIYAREKGMGDMIERNNKAIEANRERQSKIQLEKMMKESGGIF